MLCNACGLYWRNHGTKRPLTPIPFPQSKGKSTSKALFKPSLENLHGGNGPSQGDASGSLIKITTIPKAKRPRVLNEGEGEECMPIKKPRFQVIKIRATFQGDLFTFLYREWVN